MRLGIFAKTFPGSQPRQVLAHAKAAGFDMAQWNWACAGLPSMPDEISAEQCEEIAAAAREAGIVVTAVSGTYNMAHPDPDTRAAGASRLTRIIETAPVIGASTVTLCTGSRNANDQWTHHPDNDKPDAWADMRASMVSAIEAAERADVFLGIEPELGNVVSSARHARRLFDELKSDRLRIVLDPANLFEVASEQERRNRLEEAVDLLGKEIEMAHAKDRAVDGSFVAAGQGVLDYEHYLACLKASGFRGDLVTHGLTAGEAPVVAAMLKAHLGRSGS